MHLLPLAFISKDTVMIAAMLLILYIWDAWKNNSKKKKEPPGAEP